MQVPPNSGFAAPVASRVRAPGEDGACRLEPFLRVVLEGNRDCGPGAFEYDGEPSVEEPAHEFRDVDDGRRSLLTLAPLSMRIVEYVRRVGP